MVNVCLSHFGMPSSGHSINVIDACNSLGTNNNNWSNYEVHKLKIKSLLFSAAVIFLAVAFLFINDKQQQKWQTNKKATLTSMSVAKNEHFIFQ